MNHTHGNRPGQGKTGCLKIANQRSIRLARIYVTVVEAVQLGHETVGGIFDGEQQVSRAVFQTVDERLGQIALGRVKKQVGDPELLRIAGGIEIQVEVGVKGKDRRVPSLVLQFKEHGDTAVFHIQRCPDQHHAQSGKPQIGVGLRTDGQLRVDKGLKGDLGTVQADFYVKDTAHAEQFRVFLLNRRQLEF